MKNNASKICINCFIGFTCSIYLRRKQFLLSFQSPLFVLLGDLMSIPQMRQTAWLQLLSWKSFQEFSICFENRFVEPDVPARRRTLVDHLVVDGPVEQDAAEGNRFEVVDLEKIEAMRDRVQQFYVTKEFQADTEL